MLIDDIERYLALRRSLGFKLEQEENIWARSRPLPPQGANVTSARKLPSSGLRRHLRRERDITGSGISRVPRGSCTSKMPAMRFHRQASS